MSGAKHAREPGREAGMPSVSAALTAALRGEPCRVVGFDEAAMLPVARWRTDVDAGDVDLLSRCRGATVDIGCGPGRMTHALLCRGVAALGIDVVPEAVRQARERGGAALHRDVFSVLPGEGRWSTALLADGNIGIGGDPVRLLRRVGNLLAPEGRVVVDLAGPGGPVRIRRIRLEVRGATTPPFSWAVVPADQLELLAEASALRILELTQHRGRWFAELDKQGRR
jgi:SAM-dependent methyltransferase